MEGLLERAREERGNCLITNIFLCHLVFFKKIQVSQLRSRSNDSVPILVANTQALKLFLLYSFCLLPTNICLSLSLSLSFTNGKKEVPVSLASHLQSRYTWVRVYLIASWQDDCFISHVHSNQLQSRQATHGKLKKKKSNSGITDTSEQGYEHGSESETSHKAAI